MVSCGLLANDPTRLYSCKVTTKPQVLKDTVSVKSSQVVLSKTRYASPSSGRN